MGYAVLGLTAVEGAGKPATNRPLFRQIEVYTRTNNNNINKQNIGIIILSYVQLPKKNYILEKGEKIKETL